MEVLILCLLLKELAEELAKSEKRCGQEKQRGKKWGGSQG